MLVPVLFFLASCRDNTTMQNSNNDYLGLPLPGIRAELFAKDIISTRLYERDIAVTPDGNEIYYTIFLRDWSAIAVVKRAGGKWQPPQIASFARDTSVYCAEPALSSDGSRIFFLSNKPMDHGPQKPGWTEQNIWTCWRDKDGNWGTAVPLPPKINSDQGEFYASVTKNNVLYFHRQDNATNHVILMRSDFRDGRFHDPEQLPAPVNDKGIIYNAFIAPDESCLFACISGRDSLPPGMESTYVVFIHNPDGSWSAPIDLIKALHLPCTNAISISISPDMKYLFFASDKRTVKYGSLEPGYNVSTLCDITGQPGNGNSDIFWLNWDEAKKTLKR